MSYRIERTIETGLAPTPANLLAHMRQIGLDRAAMIQEPLPNRSPGILVMLDGPAAQFTLGRALIPLLQKLPSRPKFHGPPVPFTQNLTDLFTFMESELLLWCYLEADNVLGIAFVGVDVATDELCKFLTAHGCPAALKCPR